MIRKAINALAGLSFYASLILLISCDNKTQMQQTNPQIHVVKIAVADLPSLDLNRTYYLISNNRPDPEGLLTAIWNGGLPISEAWLPLDDRCADPIGARFTIELNVPDARILQYGFTQGQGRLSCATQLNQYTISE